MRKLKTAPSFHCRDMQKAVDNLCEYTFIGSKNAIEARIYFYRTRLNMKPNQVAAIFDKHPHDINEIAKRVGSKKTREIKSLEYAIQKKFESFHLGRYYNHIKKISNRINNRTLALQ